MKNIFLTLIIILSYSCKSQTVPLNTYYDDVNLGAYFKDTFDEMDKFEGTWQYTNGVDTLTITIQKKTHIYSGKYYEDLLIGEYRFTSNGVEMVNTLSKLNDFTIIGREHSISGRFIQPHNMHPICSNCAPNEKRFILHFHDSERNYLSLSLVLRYLPLSLGEPEKMTATLISTHGGMIPDENSPTLPRVPLGEYLMIKQ